MAALLVLPQASRPQAAKEAPPPGGAVNLPAGGAHLSLSRKAGHQMDRGTILNGKLNIRTTKTHPMGTIDALMANELINIMLDKSGSENHERATGCADS
jgi:hypothetical protein